MRENNKNTCRETETAFAFAVLLVNLLILAAVIGLFWSLQFLISPNSPFGSSLREMVWR